MDHHKSSFDEGTLTKLDIFEMYMREWLPVVIITNKLPTKEIWIWDFFAGPGYSIEGQPGSPIRILKEIEAQVELIVNHNKVVNVVFNEKRSFKKEQLLKAVRDYMTNSQQLSKLKRLGLLKGKCMSRDFGELFPKIIPCLGSSPSLMFFDQNGIKYISDKYLLPLLNSRYTDFLFFVSTSYFVRFSGRPEFLRNVKYVWDPTKPYKFVHRDILEFVRNKISYNSEMRVYPFTIQKPNTNNIYGLIFGASHILAAEKFLHVAWSKNKINGEANFDIDDDSSKGAPSLFEEYQLLTKVDQFKKDLETAIISREITNNVETYVFTINNGFLPSHATEVVRRLKSEKKIYYPENHPLINYNSTQKTPKRIVQYQIL